MQGLQVLVAESYGGQDEPVDTLISNCLSAEADTSMQPLRVRDTPTESTYQVCTAAAHAGQPLACIACLLQPSHRTSTQLVGALLSRLLHAACLCSPGMFLIHAC